MALIPKIEGEYNPVTGGFDLRDTTGFYHATDNPHGYGVETIQRTDIDTATVYLQINKADLKAFDVTAEIKASGDAVVDLGTFLNNQVEHDGVYRVFLHISSVAAEITGFGHLIFVDKGVSQYASEFWAKLSCIYDIYRKKKLETECIWIESNLVMLQSLKERKKESEYLNLLRFLQKRIDVNLSLIK